MGETGGAGDGGMAVSGEGLATLSVEIARLMEEVGNLERLSQEPPADPAKREQIHQRMLQVESRLERLIGQVRELNRQMTLIESWKRR